MSLSRATDHKSGRMLAYKLMCLMTVRRHDKELSPEHLTHFYRLLHVGLTGSDQVNTLVSFLLLSKLKQRPFVGRYLKGINFRGNFFSRISFFEISRTKWELVLADFRGFILNENFAETYSRG